MSAINNATATNAAQNAAQMKAERERKEPNEVQMARLANMHQTVTGMFNSFDNNQNNFDFFFGASASMSTMQAINTARTGIENRARTLLSEIRMDELRGLDTSAKREQLGNLTENLQLMNKNLSDNVDKAMKPADPREANQPSVSARINFELKKMQEKAEKEVQEKYGKREPSESDEAVDTAVEE